MSGFQQNFRIFALFLVCFGITVYSLDCQQKDDELCRNVGSLKGLICMLEGVSSALTDIVSSTKFRAEKLEDNLCISPKITEDTLVSSEDDNDHCVKAEPDCKALFDIGFKESGPYRIWPIFLNHSLKVYCDMETKGGGWTVIQRRGDFGGPHISFYEDWNTYKKGFGDILKEYWLGNDAIFALTNQAETYLRIELEDFDGERRCAKYKNFLVRSEVENYNMTIGEYDGNAGDSMTAHNGQEFSTKDKGNPCPKNYKGGWWYSKCHKANLNGLYHQGDHISHADGINWFHFRGFNHSMKFAEMKIKRCDC